ncbi:3096_t:CDS:1, partial [Entrophospora sp. SA101]
CENILQESLTQNHCFNCWIIGHKFNNCIHERCLGFVKEDYILPSTYDPEHKYKNIDSILNIEET